MKKKILKAIMQQIGNLCILGVEVSPVYQQRKQWFDMGMTLNLYLILFHDIYLD